MNQQNNHEQDSVLSQLQSKPKRLNRRLFWIAGVALIVIVAYFSASFWLQQDSGEPIYQTAKVSRGDIRATVSATGTLEPTNQVEVGSELSGTVEKVYVDYNDKVSKGQLLAELNTDKLNAQVLQSKASLKVAEANVLEAQATLQEAQDEYARLQKVFKLSNGQLPSEKELMAAKAAKNRALAAKTTALANVEQAKASLEQNETDLAKAKIHSPINGIVLEKSIEAGQTVAATMTAPVLFTLAEDLTSMELQVDVDEADVGQVQEGQSAVFTVDAYPNRSFPATIKQVRFGAESTDGVVTYATLLTVENNDMILRPGMTASADILVKEKTNVLMIPMAALRFTPQLISSEPKSETTLMQSFMPRAPRSNQQVVKSKVTNGYKEVWKKTAQTLESILIKTGDSNESMIEVIEGNLHEGDEIITGVEVPLK